jgi:hypothetical protein
MLPANPMFRLVPHRFGKKNIVPSFEEQFGPIREVRFKYRPDGNAVIDKFQNLTAKKQQAILDFLRSLSGPPDDSDASPVWTTDDTVAEPHRPGHRRRSRPLQSHLACCVASASTSGRSILDRTARHGA